MSKSHSILLAVLGVAVLVGLGLVLRAVSGGPGDSAQPISGLTPIGSGEDAGLTVAGGEDSALSVAPDADGASASGGREAAVEGGGVGSAAVRRTASDGKDVLLKGSAVAVDPDGGEHREEDGRMLLELRLRSGTQRVEVAVEHGFFRTRVPENARLSVAELVLGGRWVEQGLRGVPVPAEGFLEVRGTWPPTTLLRVVDAATRKDLEEVIVYENKAGDPDLRLRHPDHLPPSDEVLAGVESPFEVPFTAPTRGRPKILWVGAPDHAWQEVKVDLDAGGEQLVLLERAASLTVELEGFNPGAGAKLLLRRVKGNPRWLTELVVRDGEPVTVGGLVPDHYTVSVEIGVYTRPERLAEAEIDLAAGEHGRVRLEIEGLEDRASAPLSGTLELPGDWNGVDLALAIQADSAQGPGRRALKRIPLFEMEPIAGTAEEFAWDAGEVPTGRYVIEVEPLSHRLAVEVGKHGQRRVAIELAAPVELSVRLIDAETGAPADVDRVSWHGPAPKGGSSRWMTVTRKSIQEPFVFKAPRSEITLSCGSRQYYRTRATWNLELGMRDLSLPVQRACGFELEVRDGSTILPRQPGWRVKMTPREGKGSIVMLAQDYIQVSEPGLYEFNLSGLEGFQPVLPQEVMIEPWSYAKVVVHLQRDG